MCIQILLYLQVLWSGNYGTVFEATMSLNRFRFLAANLRFDDPAERKTRWPGDRFAAMRCELSPTKKASFPRVPYSNIPFRDREKFYRVKNLLVLPNIGLYCRSKNFISTVLSLGSLIFLKILYFAVSVIFKRSFFITSRKTL
jgi:hypothetical protein